jgi:hypothetical protein
MRSAKVNLVRFVLSAVAVFIGLFFLSLATQVFQSLRESRDRSQNPDPIVLGQSTAESPGSARVKPPWPRHPMAPEQRLHASVLQGVQMVSEEWSGVVAPREVLEYYRGHMVARGWLDQTEESLGLGVDTIASVKDAKILQDPTFLKKYDDVIQENLVLQRGNWSIHVHAKPEGKGSRRSAVRVVGVSVPDITRFAAETMMNLAPGRLGTGSDSVIEHEQEIGGSRHRTTLSVKPERAEKAFQTAIRDLENREWRIMLRREEPTQPTRVAWLVQGESYAALTATPMNDGKGTRLTFIEIRPK